MAIWCSSTSRAAWTSRNLTRVSVALEEIRRAVSLVASQVSGAMTMMVVS
jgi:hypothetical protein